MKKDEKEKELFRVATGVLDGTFDIKEYYNLTDEGLEAIYAAGYEFYTNKKYDKAQQVFAMLTFLDKTNKKYFYSLGASLFMLKQYIMAEISFRMCLMLGDYTPNIFMKIAECCLLSSKEEEAFECLEEVTRLAKTDKFKNDAAVKQLAERAKMMASGAKKQSEGNEAAN